MQSQGTALVGGEPWHPRQLGAGSCQARRKGAEALLGRTIPAGGSSPGTGLGQPGHPCAALPPLACTRYTRSPANKVVVWVVYVCPTNAL